MLIAGGRTGEGTARVIDTNPYNLEEDAGRLESSAAAAAATPALLNFSAEELAQIGSHGPWPPAALPAALPADTGHAWQQRSAAVAFGRSLYTDRRLSVDGQASCASCASCHLPSAGAGISG